MAGHVIPRAARPVALAGAVLVSTACAGPVVRTARYEKALGVLAVVAVAPFVAAPEFQGSPEPGTPSAAEAALLVGRLVSEALDARGISVVPPSDVRLALDGRAVAPREDAGALADLVAEKFGATSLLVGSVHRFRERRGEALGTERPASVGFEIVVYAAPSARRVWTARFDETQVAFSENVLRAWHYPGRGTRWLTAAELARWGAEQVAEAAEALR